MDCTDCLFPFAKKKTMSPYYMKAITTEDNAVITHKFLKG